MLHLSVLFGFEPNNFRITNDCISFWDCCEHLNWSGWWELNPQGHDDARFQAGVAAELPSYTLNKLADVSGIEPP